MSACAKAAAADLMDEFAVRFVTTENYLFEIEIPSSQNSADDGRADKLFI